MFLRVHRSGTEVQIAGARFSVVAVPDGVATVTLNSAPICINELVMMPSSRAEVWVTYRDANGRLASRRLGATGIFKTIGLTTGPDGDSWPAVDLAQVNFTQTGPAPASSRLRSTSSAAARLPQLRRRHLRRQGSLCEAGRRSGRLQGAGHGSSSARLLRPCRLHQPQLVRPRLRGSRSERRCGARHSGPDHPIRSVSDHGLPAAGPGQTPVHEIWELVNLATENHNFHMHQTKFRFARPRPRSHVDRRNDAPSRTWRVSWRTTCRFPLAMPKNPTTSSTIRTATAPSTNGTMRPVPRCPLFVDIPFSQLGEFVFHCHILEHEDGGMMAKIVVVPTPSATNTHDYNGDGASDMAWRDQIGDAALWLMNGATPASVGSLAGAPTTWSIVGQPGLRRRRQL